MTLLLRPLPWPLPQSPNPWRCWSLLDWDDPPLLVLLDRRDPATARQASLLAPLLSLAEHQRLQQLRRPDDRDRFLLGRGALRHCLGVLLDCDPAQLLLDVGPHGKPALRRGIGAGAAAVPQFNVAHAGDCILLALHPRRAVGVDVEQQRPGLNWPAIAARMMPDTWQTSLRPLLGTVQAEACLQAWCQLEAQLKAQGWGLAGRGAAGGTHGSGPCWSIALPAGYAGAAALA
jgi:4'-phosphopantetheinyl transferase